MFVNLPVETEFGFAVHLSPVHTEVMLPVAVFGHHQRKGDEMAAVHGPCLRNGKFGEVVLQSDPLRFSLSNLLWRHRQRVSQQRQALPRLSHVQPDIGLHHRHHTVANLGFMGGPEGPKGSVVTAKGVHQQRHRSDASVRQSGLFKQDGGAVVLDQKVGDGPGLIDHIHGALDSKQFTSLLEVTHPPPQRLPCHDLPWGFLPLNLRISSMSRNDAHDGLPFSSWATAYWFITGA